MKNLKGIIEMNVMETGQLKYGETVIQGAFVVNGYQDHKPEFIDVVVDEKLYKQVKPNTKVRFLVNISSKINGKYLQDSIRAEKLIV